MNANKTIEELFSRKSVRAYQPREIDPEEKRLIIDSAIQAPSAGNMELYSVIDVTDQGMKEQLSVLCDNQPFIARAPMVLVFLADYQRWYDGFCRVAGEEARRPAEGDFLLACMDALIAAQNAVTAAWALGIGSCYIGDIIERCEEVSALLGLPQYTAPAAMLCFGYPAQQQLEREKPTRFDAKHLVFENKYRRADRAEQDEMFEPRGGAEKGFSAIYKRKWSAPFTEEMTRSVKKWLERWNNGPDGQ